MDWKGSRCEEKMKNTQGPMAVMAKSPMTEVKSGTDEDWGQAKLEKERGRRMLVLTINSERADAGRGKTA